MIKVKLFVSVAQEGNPGKSGYCALLRYGPHERKIEGATHGVYCEVALRAMGEAIQKLSKPVELYIYTDLPCIDWMQGRYKLADAYQELVSDTLQMIENAGHKITWIVNTDDPLAEVAAHAAKGAL